MLRRTTLLDEGGLRLEDVRCASGRAGWSEPEPCTSHAIVFVRRGCFRRRSDGTEAVLDPAVVYFENCGHEQQIAHPHENGDACTLFALAPAAVAQLWGGDPRLPSEPHFSEPLLDLQHRRLVANARSDETFELAERAILLAAQILERAHAARVASGRPATAAARRQAVDDARELLASRPRAGLFELARAVSVSPHHLSRIFADATGSSISQYRNDVRVRVALDRIADGERSLARLAADLGFADQAHLTRVVRRQVGDAPSRLRALLGPV